MGAGFKKPNSAPHRAVVFNLQNYVNDYWMVQEGYNCFNNQHLPRDYNICKKDILQFSI